MSVTLVPVAKGVGEIQMSNGSWADLRTWGVLMPAGMVVRGEFTYFYERIGNPAHSDGVKIKSVRGCEACAMAARGMISALEEGMALNRSWIGEREKISLLNLREVAEFLAVCKGFHTR